MIITLVIPISNSDNFSVNLMLYQIIVWSPVGCSAEQYSEALAVSVQSKRAVRYIRWGMEIPVISFEELIRANLVTFLRTGRCVR